MRISVTSERRFEGPPKDAPGWVRASVVPLWRRVLNNRFLLINLIGVGLPATSIYGWKSWSLILAQWPLIFLLGALIDKAEDKIFEEELQAKYGDSHEKPKGVGQTSGGTQEEAEREVEAEVRVQKS